MATDFSSGDGDYVKIDPAQLEQDGHAIQDKARQLRELLDTLYSTIVAPAVAQWEGGTSDAYMVSQKKWNDSADEVQEILADIAKEVLDTAADYRATESKNMSAWA